jgi:hypothetical protein
MRSRDRSGNSVTEPVGLDGLALSTGNTVGLANEATDEASDGEPESPGNEVDAQLTTSKAATTHDVNLHPAVLNTVSLHLTGARPSAATSR